jgi:hypothetical protein
MSPRLPTNNGATRILDRLEADRTQSEVTDSVIDAFE